MKKDLVLIDNKLYKRLCLAASAVLSKPSDKRRATYLKNQLFHVEKNVYLHNDLDPRIEKLKEIRDNINRTVYLRELLGDADDLEKLIKFIFALCKKLGITTTNCKEVHDILFWICSRMLSISMKRLHVKYKEGKTAKSFDEMFGKLCETKNDYWKFYLRTRNE